MNHHKLITYFTQIISQEKHTLWLWISVFFGAGVIFSFLNYNSAPIFLIIILCAAILLFYFDKFSYRGTFYLISAVFLLGFFWTFFYQKSIYDKQIKAKVFADLKGEIIEIKRFSNSVTQKTGISLIIAKPQIYKIEKFQKKIVKKKKKNKSKKIAKKEIKKEKKMTKKFLKLLDKCQDEACKKEVQQAFLKHEEEKKQRREARFFAKKCGEDEECIKKLKQEKAAKKAKKIKKISKRKAKQIEQNFLNISDYQEIDRYFIDISNSYQNVKWQKQNDKYLFPNPPSKVSLISHFDDKNLKIGDVVFMRVLLDKPRQREFLNEFDFGFDSLNKRIGGFGYVAGKIHILKEEKISSFENYIKNLRHKINIIITSQIKGDEGAIVSALLIGNSEAISKNAMLQIRNSGLAHLLSISGLHMAIAAAIFFTSIRFLLVQSQYLALNFNIKKIAAFAAILSTYFYLQLSGSPAPALRSFIVSTLILLAIIFDKKVDAKRSIALAFLILLIYNPYNIFSISFQLSFAAILSLVAFHEFISKFKPQNLHNSFYKRFIWYFCEIAFASIIVQIATAPFLIYHFKNFSTYGLVANMLAIPLTSFFTMPLGFLSLILMPMGLEAFTLKLTGYSITILLEIAQIVSSWKFAYFTTLKMPKIAFALAVGGFVINSIMNSKIKWLGGLIFLSSFASLYFVKQPNLAFDSTQKFFAIYNETDGLIFNKELRASKKRDLWMQEFSQKDFRSFQDFDQEILSQKGINCDERKCIIEIENKKILILLKRNKLSEICFQNLQNNFDIIVNLTSKYKMPKCLENYKTKIDNLDFYRNGGYFLYFNKGKFDIKSARSDF